MKAKVYIETTVISYLTARISGDLTTAAKQHITREWWNNERHKFDLYISSVVLDEVSRGDSVASSERLSLLKNSEVSLIELNKESQKLGQLISSKYFPKKAANDGLHIGLAAMSGLDYILTWNFAHIGNATLRNAIIKTCEEFDVLCPIICNPESLMS